MVIFLDWLQLIVTSSLFGSQTAVQLRLLTKNDVRVHVTIVAAVDCWKLALNVGLN